MEVIAEYLEFFTFYTDLFLFVGTRKINQEPSEAKSFFSRFLVQG